MSGIDWQAVNALMQWIVVPSLVWVWHLQKRTNEHETMLKVMSEVLKERKSQRDEDREDMRRILEKIDRTLERLANRLEDVEREAGGSAR